MDEFSIKGFDKGNSFLTTSLMTFNESLVSQSNCYKHELVFPRCPMVKWQRIPSTDYKIFFHNVDNDARKDGFLFNVT